MSTKPKARRRRRTAAVAAILISIIALIIMLVLFARPGTSGGTGGFPIRVSGLSVEQIGMIGNDIAVAEDAVFELYDSGGNQRYSVDLNYASPVFVTSQNRALIYDRGGNRMKICNRSGEVCSKEVEGQILTCGFGGGRAAAAVLSDSTTSMLTVYDVNLIEEIFVWQTSSYIARVAVSPNGKYVAAATINNENGDVYSEVTVFDTKSTEPLFTNKYPGETVLSLRFLNNSDITVVTDKSISGISGRSELAYQNSFEYGSLSGIACSDNGKTALILSKISDGRDYVTLYNEAGEVVREMQIDSAAIGLSLSNSKIFVLYSDKLVRYPASDKESEPQILDIQSDSIKVLANGNTAYVLTSDEIQKF